MGTHVVPVEMVGVDPDARAADVYRFACRSHPRAATSAPASAGDVVVGKAIADRLSRRARRRDRGDRGRARAATSRARMLRIVGIVATGSEDADAAICQVARSRTSSGSPALRGAGEVTRRAARLARDRRRPRRARGRAGAAATRSLTWAELTPEFEGHLEQDAATSRFGQRHHPAHRAARRRERAAGGGARAPARVRGAVGARHERRAHGAARRAGGADARPRGRRWSALAVGLPLVWRLRARRPRLPTASWAASYSFQGVLFEPVIYGDFGCVDRRRTSSSCRSAPRCSRRSTRRGSRRAPIRPSP